MLGEKMDIEKRTDEITEQIYAGYGSGTGILFGIPSSLRDAVRAVVKVVVRVEYKEGLKEGVTRFAWWKEGVQYVGTTGKTLKQALEDIDNDR